MSGRVFVHIGLPKTATTTLQTEVFPSLASDEIHYHGVLQPRQENDQSPIYTRFCDAVYTRSALEDVRSTLTGMLKAGTTIVLSEEMITVSAKDASWRVKLNNLAEILHGLDYVLILTVREPTAALFSYYVELNEKLTREERNFLELVKSDDRMHIFHYGKLTDAIFEHFDRDSVFVKTFEDVVAGRLDDLCRLITSGKQGWHGLQPKNHNERKRVGNVVYTGKNFTLADMARRLARFLGLNDAGYVVKTKKALVPIVRCMDSVALSKEKVMKPSRYEMEQLKNYLSDETAALEKHFGIRYE